MNIFQFVSELIGSLVWPIIVIILVVLLRKEIRELLASITRLKYKDLEMDFQHLAESAKKLPPSPPLSASIPTGQTSYISLEDQILGIVEQAPSAAILLAWASIETAMSSAVSRMAISPDSPLSRSAYHDLVQLKDWAGLPEEVFQTIDEMRMLRNKVAHDEKQRFQISKDGALTYVETAIRIVKLLNGLSYLPSK
jgi:hypothetical protein